MLFYQFYAKLTTFFDQELFGLAPLLYVDVEMLAETDVKWRQDAKMTSKRQNRHIDVMHESSLTFQVR